jgi:hypothetical protein
VHCELVVPALIPSERLRAAFGEPRLPALEMLLARGRMASEERRGAERWLADAFGLDEDELPAGALGALAAGGDPGAHTWLRADPVHLRLLRDELRLVPSEGFTVSRAEAEALCASLNAHFDGELVFQPLDPEHWCVRMLSGELTVEAPAPLEIAGENVDAHLPAGPDAMRLRALLNEVQMLLHASPVNEARESRGEPVVNSVWLWGAGRSPGKLEARWQSVGARDPLALGLARLAGDAYGARLQALEARWFGPLLAALKAGRIGMVTVHVPDAEEALSFETVRADLRRFWRRPRAVGDYA